VRPKAVTLAVIEIGPLFLVIYGTLLLWTHPFPRDWLEVATCVGGALALSLCFVVSFYYNDLYDLRMVRSFGEFIVRLPYSLGVSFFLIVLFYKFFPDVTLDGRPFFSSLLSSLLAAGLLLPLRGIFYTVIKIRALSERVLILGTGSLAQKIAEEVEATSPLSYSIVGFVDGGDDGGAVPARGVSSSSYQVLGTLSHLEKIIEELRPDRIIVALTERRGRMPVRDLLNARMAGVPVEDGIEVHERFTGKLAIESLTPSFLIFSRDFKKSKFQMALQRAVSLAIAAVGLILTAPLMVFIAIAIKLDSEGPVFFVQDRAGFEGRTFRLVKFRTMHPASAEETESVWSRDVKSRVTRVGKWLRRLALDELPQFVNILRGDMDLVGPRPEMVSNVKTMTEQIPYYSLRMAVRPGITGWAQIKHGYSVSQDDVTEKMRYDLYYVKHMSLWFDARILIDTVKIILFSRGSDVKDHAETKPYETPATEPSEINFLQTEKPTERGGV
jgi:sugar transferase (PEP-CTERM system associated)